MSRTKLCSLIVLLLGGLVVGTAFLTGPALAQDKGKEKDKVVAPPPLIERIDSIVALREQFELA